MSGPVLDRVAALECYRMPDGIGTARPMQQTVRLCSAAEGSILVVAEGPQRMTVLLGPESLRHLHGLVEAELARIGRAKARLAAEQALDNPVAYDPV